MKVKAIKPFKDVITGKEVKAKEVIDVSEFQGKELMSYGFAVSASGENKEK